MNERVMQFRIGMFVIVAGLVLTMLIVWFGESPSLFRDQSYVTVHFVEAPGVSEGIPVRKSGIRIGEVASIRFDDRTRMSGQVMGIVGKDLVVDLGQKGKGTVPLDQFPKAPPKVGTSIDVLLNRFDAEAKVYRLALPDGVLVTLALDRKYKIKAGAQPRISRALIGDVSIDMLPGSGQGALTTSDNPQRSPIIEGSVAPDPAGALAAATEAFEKVGTTLDSIQGAAEGLRTVSKKAENIDEFLASFTGLGKKVGTLADNLNEAVAANKDEIKPAMANFRQVTEKLNATLDPQTTDNFRKAVAGLSAGSAKLDRVLSDVGATGQGPRRPRGLPADDRLRPDRHAVEQDQL